MRFRLAVGRGGLCLSLTQLHIAKIVFLAFRACIQYLSNAPGVLSTVRVLVFHFCAQSQEVLVDELMPSSAAHAWSQASSRGLHTGLLATFMVATLALVAGLS